MLKHNLLLILRNFKRYKSSFIINIVGLSTGLTCGLLIYLWVHDEFNVDKFHQDSNQIFQVLENRDLPGGLETNETTSGYMGMTLAEDMPEVEYSTSVSDMDGKTTLSVESTDIRGIGKYVGKDFFNIFSYPILYGVKDQMWAERNSMMISEALARKLFMNSERAVGKTVEFEHDRRFTISAVFKDIPAFSSFQCDFILSFEEFGADNKNYLSWDNTPTSVYVKLKPGVNTEVFNQKIKGYVNEKTGNRILHRTPFLTNYEDQYLYGKYENGMQVGGRIQYVRLFSLIAIFILVIACINFMNLSTAKATRKIKDVGIKKAIGADRKSLIFYYLGESMAMAFLSLLIAVLLVLILLPQFNGITGKELTLGFDSKLVLYLLGIVFVTGLVSGSYPALYLSGFSPATVLKGKINSATGQVWARKGLVILQFTTSVILIVAVLVVYKQIKLVQMKDLGYNKDNIIVFEREGKTEADENMEAFLSEIKNIPGIVGASAIGHGLTGKDWGVYGFEWEGKDPEDQTQFELVVLYHDILEILEIELVGGRPFSRDFSNESSKIVLNESAIKHMGLKDPVGKTIKFWGRDREIIGVAKDFHFESLHEDIGPLMFSFWPERTDRIMARIERGRERETIGKIQEFYQDYNSGFPLDYSFLDQNYQAQYLTEGRVAILSRYFAGLAILISCLGLFGLASFSAERRQKEIGIRKILGSSERNIVYLLSKEFMKTVLISISIALPMSYFLTKSWLATFAFRISLEWWYFASAGVLALVITWLTIGFQMIKSSRISPVESLQEE